MPEKDVIEKIIRGNSASENVIRIIPTGGGCINDTLKIETGNGSYFLKMNDARSFPRMFESEAKGLKILGRASSVRVPEVLGAGHEGRKSFLLLEWIEQGKRNENFWEEFGEKMAALHRQTQSLFGLDHDNYIGSLPQSNKPHRDWIDFFIHERISPMLKLALAKGPADNALLRRFEKLFSRLPGIIPREPPSLLHGDLWSGNFICDDRGDACLIDPSVYYGHREMDLSMAKLFGGFDEGFFRAYHARFPLNPGFEERKDIHNLYPLLVHVNLFGGGYLNSVRQILTRFV